MQLRIHERYLRNADNYEGYVARVHGGELESSLKTGRSQNENEDLILICVP
jgi:hypothetical protein